jgi:hypothetical protein
LGTSRKRILVHCRSPDYVTLQSFTTPAESTKKKKTTTKSNRYEPYNRYQPLSPPWIAFATPRSIAHCEDHHYQRYFEPNKPPACCDSWRQKNSSMTNERPPNTTARTLPNYIPINTYMKSCDSFDHIFGTPGCLHANGSAPCPIASVEEKGLCKAMNIWASSRLRRQPKSLNIQSRSAVQERRCR